MYKNFKCAAHFVCDFIPHLSVTHPHIECALIPYRPVWSLIAHYRARVGVTHCCVRKCVGLFHTMGNSVYGTKILLIFVCLQACHTLSLTTIVKKAHHVTKRFFLFAVFPHSYTLVLLHKNTASEEVSTMSLAVFECKWIRKNR